MAKKTKAAGGPSAESVERLLKRGDAKAALKEAKVRHQRRPDGPNRELLERAHVARVEQLHRKKQFHEAREALAKLLDLKPALAEVRKRIPKFKALLGFGGSDATALLANDINLVAEMTDAAILDERSLPPDIPELKARIANVRRAFAAIERGDDAEAIELLADIPRNSPLSDWKLFLRGLAAFYQSDRERTDRNWRRLDPERPAYRISQALLVAAGDLPPNEAGCHVATAINRLESRLQTDPALDLLERLGRAWDRGDWKGVVRGLNRLIARFGESHARLIEQFVDRAWKQAIRTRGESPMRELARLDYAPPLDPHWNRARALRLEQILDEPFEAMEQSWLDYAEDIREIPLLAPEEQSIASGLVYHRLAGEYLEFAEEVDVDDIFEPADPEEADRLRRKSADAFREAIARAPRLIKSYRALASLQDQLEEPDQAAKTTHQLLEQCPKDFDAHIWLANYYLGIDDPAAAETHISTACRLKPRDPSCLALDWNLRVTTIRCLVLARDFDGARQAWELAVQEKPADVDAYLLECLRAALEYRAKDEKTAEQFVDRAVKHVQQPAPVWLQMSALAARYKLPAAVKKSYQDRLKKDLSKRIKSVTAGDIARLLLRYHHNQDKYVGRVAHERLFVKALQRSHARMTWNDEDLREVCRLLARLGNQAHLRSTLVKQGGRRFPKDPFFQFWSGQIEFARGPFRADVNAAVSHFNRALHFADPSRSPEERELVEEAQRCVGLLEDAQEQARAMFGFDMDDDEEDEEWDDEDDWDDEDEDDDDDDIGAATGGTRQGAFGFGRSSGRSDRGDDMLPPDFQGAPKSVVFEAVNEMARELGINPDEIPDEIFDSIDDRREQDSAHRRKSK